MGTCFWIKVPEIYNLKLRNWQSEIKLKFINSGQFCKFVLRSDID